MCSDLKVSVDITDCGGENTHLITLTIGITVINV